MKSRPEPATTPAASLSRRNACAIGGAIRDLRRRAHLSQGELARRLGMRQGPLCNLEKGKNLPSAPVLLKLADILGVTTDEILRPAAYAASLPGASYMVHESALVRSEEPPNPYGMTIDHTFYDFPGARHWHASSGRAACPGRHLARKIEELIKSYLALEDICQVPRFAQVPFHIPHTTTAEGIARLSGQMRGLFGISHAVVFDYLELFENHGLRVIFTTLSKVDESLSFLDLRHQNCFILAETALNSERQIFRLAYELGRLLLNPPAGAPLDDKPLDKAARLFAANFLMPPEVMRNCVSQVGVRPDEWDMPLLLRLKHRFGVSAETFNYRLLELGLITAPLQQKLRARIREYYAARNYAEPGQSRRILSPNGRLGDLLHTALRKKDAEAGNIARRLRELEVETSQESDIATDSKPNNLP